MAPWKRYHFQTASVDDPRPLVFNPHYPWWVSASGYYHARIVAYLPANEPLERYWPDAAEIEFTEEVAITFSERFPRPDYFQEE